ncbi:MAG: glycosyltransferase family 4 protein [Thermoanaerobaculia bacterium]
MITIPEPRPVTWVADRLRPVVFDVPKAIVRSRIAALGYRPVWRRIANDPDAVVHMGMNASALRPPAVPTVYECVDSTLSQLGSRHFRRAAARRCVVHCQTQRIQSALEKQHAGNDPQWSTVVSPSYFAHYEDAPAEQERDAGLIAFVGRLSPEKNPLLFIEALALARRQGADCRAVMLGEGPLQADVEALIARHDLSAHVSVSFVSRPFEILRRSAIFATLQAGDNYGSQSLLEAMGAGCAVIASDVGETARIVSDELGLRVPITVEAVARAMVTLVGDPSATRAIGREAEQIARTKYSADAYAAFLESLYESACQFHLQAEPADGRRQVVG